MFFPQPRLGWLPFSGQGNGAGGGDFFRREWLIRQVKARTLPSQALQCLLYHRTLMCFPRLLQVVVQVLWHVCEEQIGHEKKPLGDPGVGSVFAIILSARAGAAKPGDDHIANTGTQTCALIVWDGPLRIR